MRITESSILVKLLLFVVILLCVFTTPAYAGAGRLNTNGRMDFEVNFRFPPTSAQIEQVKTAIRDAGNITCDATDGQVRFQNVRLTGGSVDEDRANIWILAEQGRSGVQYATNGSHIGTLWRHIDLFSNNIDGGVIAHEFGHHAFGLGEQYDEQRRWGGACGIGPGFEAGVINNQNNSIMQQSPNASELSVAANHDRLQGNNVSCPLPRAATSLVVDARLDSSAPITTFDSTNFTTAKNTSALTSDVEVIDSAGAIPAHTLKLYFVRTGASAWTLNFGIDDGDISGGTAGNLRILNSINLTFNSNGSLASLNPASPTLPINNLANGAANLSLALDVGTLNNFDGVREGGGDMRFTLLQSNGFPRCNDADCAQRWNTTTSRFETSDQSLVHPGLSDWDTLRQNYSFITPPTGLPTAAQPVGGNSALSFTDDVNGTDQVMLFIDRSGSMSTPVETGSSSTRLDFAKAAARAFVDLQAGRGASVGLVSFEENPRLDRRLVDLPASDATPFKNQIDGLATGGNTGIGTALTAAGFEFQGVEAAGRTRTAFLLSDGENNRGEDPRAAADRLKTQGVRIFTIPVGSAADRNLLSGIAGSTNGVMFDAPSGNELPPIYAELAARFRGEGLALPRTESAVAGKGPIISQRLEPFPNGLAIAVPNIGITNEILDGNNLAQNSLPQQEEFPFQIEGGAQRVNVLLSARNLDVRDWSPGFRLISPNGEVISDLDEQFVARDPFYRLVKIPTPAPGIWKLQVFSRTSNDQFSFVLAHVENSAPDVFVDAQPRITTPSQAVSISVGASFVADLEGPVSFSGTVRRPDGSTVPLNFERNARTRSTSAAFNAFIGRGIYEVNVKGEIAEGAKVLTGESIFGGPEQSTIEVKPFVRFARTSFFLDDPNLPPCTSNDCDGDGIPNDTEGNSDTDRDGLPDLRDDDADGDDVPDAVEGTVDTDGDGIPDFQDTDSDNDGIPDGSDPDRTRPNPQQPDGVLERCCQNLTKQLERQNQILLKLLNWLPWLVLVIVLILLTIAIALIFLVSAIYRFIREQNRENTSESSASESSESSDNP